MIECAAVRESSLLASLPMDVVGHVLSYTTRDFVVQLRLINTNWLEACRLTLRRRISITSTQFHSESAGILDHLVLLCSNGYEVYELTLHLSGNGDPVMGEVGWNCPLRYTITQITTLELFVFPSDESSIKNISGLFEDILGEFMQCDRVSLRSITVRSPLTDRLIQCMSGLCSNGVTGKGPFLTDLHLGLIDWRSPHFESRFKITENRFAAIVGMLDNNATTLEKVTMRVWYRNGSYSPPNRTGGFAGELIGMYEGQRRFIQIFQRMNRLLDFEFDFFPRLVEFVIPNRVKRLSIRIAQSPTITSTFNLGHLLSKLPEGMESLELRHAMHSRNTDMLPRPRTELSDLPCTNKARHLSSLIVEDFSLGFGLAILKFPEEFFAQFPGLRVLHVKTHNALGETDVLTNIIQHCAGLEKLRFETVYPENRAYTGIISQTGPLYGVLSKHSRLILLELSTNTHAGCSTILAPGGARKCHVTGIPPLHACYYRETLLR